MTTTKFIKNAISCLLIVFLLSGCAGKKEKGLKTIQGDPETMYKQGLVSFNKKLFKDALEKFEQLKSNFPDSPPYTVWAELKVADCHYSLKEYVEAAAGYEEFRKIHPTYEEIPYVQFQIGMSYFSQVTTSDRDQTFTRKALANFEYLVANYPPNLFTEKAKDKIGLCKKHLGEHEFHIGNYYYRQEKYQAAVSRFEQLIEKFPKWLDEDKTLLYLGKSYIELNQEAKAKETLVRLVNDYPGSPYSKEARIILSKGLKAKKTSRKAVEAKKAKGKMPEPEPEGLVMVKYEEEGRRAISLKEEKVSLPDDSEAAKPIPSQEEVKKDEPPSASTPAEEERAKAAPEADVGEKATTPETTPSMEEEQSKAAPEPEKGEEKAESQPSPPAVKEDAKSGNPTPSFEDIKIALVPQKEASDSPSLPKAETRVDKPGGEEKMASLPGILALPTEKAKPQKEAPAGPSQESKIGDAAQPIDILSDSVEAYSKDNLILFKGNVTARQKDMVIYADSLEAVIIQDGKGIERVVAGGNVKIQQGLRVANCQKAIFYNLDKKVVLTGDPKVSEGDNIVSGDEIVFDIDQNRIEVKGGTGGRGKVRIHPKEETEKKE